MIFKKINNSFYQLKLIKNIDEFLLDIFKYY